MSTEKVHAVDDILHEEGENDALDAHGDENGKIAQSTPRIWYQGKLKDFTIQPEALAQVSAKIF